MSLLTSVFIHIAIQGGLLVRILARRYRSPASRMAWIVVVVSIPIAGIVAYLLFGETNIGKRYVTRRKLTKETMPDEGSIGCRTEDADPGGVPERRAHLFQMGKSINGFNAVGGNSAELMPGSNQCIERMVADIDAAEDHVHLSFYIWLPDGNGLKMAAALKRAAARGVTCRALADDLGSRDLIKSEHWKEMAAAGVRLQRALPIGNPLVRALYGRIDLRNHRKILIVDNRITYCGSQNCADPEFLPKADYAPWVDAMLRIEGPVVRQNQFVFVTDWMTFSEEKIAHLVTEPIEDSRNGFPAQVVATGPTLRPTAMPEMFESLIYSARSKLFVTTPYYAPNEGLQAALRAAGHRGVETTVILPRRNDDFAVAATSRSYYLDLLQSGVRLFEYEPGLLHAKTITVDGDITFIGSANMDRRSFELNFENNMLICDREVTHALRSRQAHYLKSSRPVTLPEVEAWPLHRRLVDNAIAIVSPLL